MTEHSWGFPCGIKIAYHVDGLAHTMLLNAREWNAAGGTHGHGSFEAWDTTTRDVQDMIEGLVGLMLPLFTTSATFDGWQLFTKDAADAPARPREEGTFTAMVGTITPSVQHLAIQRTIVFRDTDFNIAKLVLLEAEMDKLGKVGSGTWDPDVQALAEQFQDSANAWSSRANLRPVTPLHIITTDNKKLRRLRGMD